MGAIDLAMPLAVRILATGSHEATTSGVWKGEVCVAALPALRAASAIMLAATTPLAMKKSGWSAAPILAAMSRLPTRATCTGSLAPASTLLTRSSLTKASTSTAISPLSGSAVAMAACSCAISFVSWLLRIAKNRAPPNSANKTTVPARRFGVFMSGGAGSFRDGAGCHPSRCRWETTIRA